MSSITHSLESCVVTKRIVHLKSFFTSKIKSFDTPRSRHKFYEVYSKQLTTDRTENENQPYGVVGQLDPSLL